MRTSVRALARPLSLALAVLLAAPLVAVATAPAASAATTTVVVDDGTAPGTHGFEFGAGWNAESGLDPARWHDGTEHWARGADRSSFTFRFTGERARLFGIKDVPHGIYAVSVDGGAETLVDAYAPTRTYKQLLFDTGALTSGPHAIVVRLTGDKNAAASRADGQIDFAEVLVQTVAATGVALDQAPVTLYEGLGRQLEAAVEPVDATEKGITWSSSDPGVATVSSTGRVAAVGPGTAAITATTVDGGHTASVAVTVAAAPAELGGAVGDTNFHYVTAKSFDDYRRMYLEDVIGLTDRAWQDEAWRNDRVSGQFVLWTGSEAKTGVRVDSAALAGPGGWHLDGLEVSFVQSVLAGRGRPALGNPQEPIPDVISSAATVAIPASSVQPVWMTVDVPAAAPVGTYTGTVVVVSDQGDRIEFPLELDVIDLELPAPGDWDQFVDLWQNPYAVARTAGIPRDRLWTEEHFAAMLPHYQRLRDAGQDVITATVVHDPWASQTYDPYDSMVSWTKNADGTWAFDFSVFDAWVEFMIDDVGIDGQIDAYSMVNWASKVRYLDAATGQTVTADVQVGTAVWTQMWGAFLRAFGPHLTEKGWFDKTYMAMDERALGDIIKAVDLIDVNAPGLKVGAAMNYNSLSDPRLDRIDKISVSADHVKIGDPVFREVMAHRRALGLITSIYYCVGIYPNTFIRSNLAEAAFVQWTTVGTGSDGYLRWAYDSFVADPFTTTDFRTWESGDTAQVYPGNVSSVRWERMNEGIRDAEKVRMLSATSPEVADDLAAVLAAMPNTSVMRDPYGGVIDPGDVDIPAEVDRLEAELSRISHAVAPSADPVVEVSTSTRCLAGKAVLAVRVVNADDSPIGVRIATSYGEKAFAAVAPGKSAFHAFTTRTNPLPAGEVTVDATAVEGGASNAAVVPYEDHACG